MSIILLHYFVHFLISYARFAATKFLKLLRNFENHMVHHLHLFPLVILNDILPFAFKFFVHGKSVQFTLIFIYHFIIWCAFLVYKYFEQNKYVFYRMNCFETLQNNEAFKHQKTNQKLFICVMFQFIIVIV